MKRFLGVLAIVAAGLLAYNYVTTGKVKLIPGASMSDVESRLADLQDQVADARSQVAQAGRSAGMTGLDSTADVSAARRVVEETARAFEELKPKLETEAEKERARELAAAITQFRRDAG
jgi:hypothetical protein